MRLFLCCLVVILLQLNRPAVADSFDIARVSIEAEVQRDGTIQFAESRTYRFDGLFRWADYRLPKAGFSELRDIRIEDNGRLLIHDNSGEPGTFLVEETEGYIRFKWHFEALDEERTFTIFYTLVDAVVVGPEWSEFMWIYLSDGWGMPTGEFESRLAFRRAVPPDSVTAWVRGAEGHITLDFLPDAIRAVGSDIRSDQHVLIRSVFPTSMVDLADVTDPDYSLAWAEADEAAWRERREMLRAEQAERERNGMIALALISFLSVLTSVLFYRRFGKRHVLPELVPKLLYEPPSADPPAIAGWFTNYRQVHGGQLIATVFDLARRGHLAIIEDTDVKRKPKEPVFRVERKPSPPGDRLEPFEASLLDYVDENIADGNDRLDKLFSAERSATAKWFHAWRKEVTDVVKGYGWIDETSTRAARLHVAAQAPLLVAAILSAILIFAPAGVIAASAVIVVKAVGSIALLRFTLEGQQRYLRWKSYRRALSKGAVKDGPSGLADLHFVYAVAFGLSKTDLERLLRIDDEMVLLFAWITFAPGTQMSPATLAKSISAVASSGATSVSSVAGGVGATAGVAGGGAVGSAGR